MVVVNVAVVVFGHAVLKFLQQNVFFLSGQMSTSLRSKHGCFGVVVDMQPMPFFWQHHACLSLLQHVSMQCRPFRQSGSGGLTGVVVVMIVVAAVVVGQPMPTVLQQNRRFSLGQRYACS